MQELKDASNTDFYVGYEHKAAKSIRAWLACSAVVLLILVCSLALVLVFGQMPFAASRFDYQNPRPYEGRYRATPYPVLLNSDGPLLLVGPGKQGAERFLKAASGEVMSLDGMLIKRGDARMLQIQPSSIRTSSAGPHADAVLEDLGSVTLTGEIVDTKCFFGVMNPGSGKVHRACAVRCISGGVPPGILVRDANGLLTTILLVGSDGRKLGREVLDYVAEPITLTGRLQRAESLLLLKVEPNTFIRE